MGSAVDPTGLSFTVTKKDGTTASVSPQTLTPTTWGDTVGTQTCTFTYTDGYDSVSCEVEANVQALPEPVLESLEVTGSLTNTQYYGEAPDLTGLTVKAVYDNGDKETLDVSDLTISPATWTLPGTVTVVPFEDDLTISYTEEDVTVTSGVDNVAIHGKSSYTIPLDTAAIVYYDGFSIPEWTQEGDVSITGAASLFTQSATPQVGDWVFLQFDQSAYENDTTVDGTAFMGYVSDFGVDPSNWAPHVGAVGEGYGMQYSTAAITGEGTTQSSGTAYNVAGKLVNAITGSTGYKLSDISTTDRHVTSVTFTV